MVALILALAAAAPVQIPGPQLQSLDDSKVRRVPAFSGTGPREATPAWLGDRYPEFAPDGRHVAVEDYDTEKLSVRTLSGDILWSLPTEQASSPRFVGEGLMTTSNGYDEGWALRDVNSGGALARFDGYPPDRVVPAPGGKRLAVEIDGALRILARTGEELHSWPIDSYPDGVQFSRDGQRVLICDDGLRLWDLERGRVVFFERDPHWNGCAADPELAVAYMARDDGLVERIELQWDGTRTAWPVGSPARDIAWVAPDVVFVATGRPYTSVLDLGKGVVVAHLEGRAHDVMVVDGELRRLGDRVARWSWPKLEPAQTSPRAWDASAIAATDEVVATGDRSGTVLITRGSKLVQHLWGFAEEITDLAFHGDRLAVGDESGHVTVFRWATGEIEHQIRVIRGSMHVAWSPDGKTLIASSVEDDDPSWMEIWDTTTWTRRHRSQRDDLAHFAFASHGRWFAAAGDNASDLQVIDTATGTILRSLPVPYRQDWTHVAVVDDQQVVAYSVGDDDNYLWHPPAEAEKVEAWGWAAAFTDDGRKLAVDADEELVIFDATTGKELRQVPADGIHALTWTPDGRTVVGAMADGTLKRWSHGPSGSPAQRSDFADLTLVDLDDAPSWSAARRVSVGRHAESLSVANDGRIAVAPVDQRVQLLSAEGEKVTSLGNGWDYGDAIEHVWFADDGALVTSDRNHLTQVWRDAEVVDQRERCDLATLAQEVIQCGDRYAGHGSVWRGAISVDGAPLPSQPGEPTRSARSPDGRTIVVAGDELAVVWDVKRRTPIARIEANARGGVAWTADGAFVLLLGGGELSWWAP